MTASDLPLNYRYWREHGREWPGIYDQRKKHQVMYHLQEILLADYMARQAPARLLEYGCGFGRHLSYLSQIDGLDVYGYDQSFSMAAGVKRWASAGWASSHIVTGEPVGHLPYASQSFDIVFTAETLVHVRPADLPAILSELVRISRSQIYHLETAADYPLFEDAHDGCWYHDLVAVYAQLGYHCEILPRGYRAHVPYRVLLKDLLPAAPNSERLADQMRRFEADIQATIDAGQATASDAATLGALVASLQGNAAEQQERALDLENQRTAAQAAANDQIQTLTKNLAGARDQRDASQAELAGARDQLQAARQELTSTHEQLDTTRAEFRNVQDQLQAAQRDLMSTREALQGMQTQLTDSHEQLRVAKSQLTSVLSDLESANQHAVEIAERYATFVQQLNAALIDTNV